MNYSSTISALLEDLEIYDQLFEVPMSSVHQKNKRKTKRFGCMVPVEGKQGGEFDTIQTVDFGKNGFGFVSSKPIPLDKEIPIEIDVDKEEDPILVIGQVCWVRSLNGSEKYRVGIKFKEILRGSKSRLNQYFHMQG
ncbi:MAG: PilZ domain-containing protein [Candidatus Omnitrophica bacterium]|nr:PilZ domain-containing protein [Candidatus Omnitrophota bacterium]